MNFWNSITFLIISLLISFSALADKPINIAVIDTGIDPTHPLFSQKLRVGSKVATNNVFGVDFSSLDGKVSYRPFDKNGHGTHIAGIIAKINPKARLHILKYYNPEADGYQNLKATIRALRYAIENNMDVINYSSGGPERSPEEASLFKQAKDKGILIVSAAGNEFRDIDADGSEGFYPASYNYQNIITVGALDKKMNRVGSSNWGTRSVDIFAPGKKIKSAFPNYQVAEMTGTSQATAFVSGAVSLILEKKSFKSKNNKFLGVKKILFKTGYHSKRLESLCLSSSALNIKELKKYLFTNDQPIFKTASSR